MNSNFHCRLGNRSIWGQIPIQDNDPHGARDAERNWTLTPIAAPERVSSTHTHTPTRMTTP
jgi:hypothetical protein